MSRPIAQSKSSPTEFQICCPDEITAVKKECINCCLNYPIYIKTALFLRKTALLKKISEKKGWETYLEVCVLEKYIKSSYSFYSSIENELNYLIKNGFIDEKYAQKFYDQAVIKKDFCVIRILLKYSLKRNLLKINAQEVLSILLLVGIKPISNLNKYIIKQSKSVAIFIHSIKGGSIIGLSPIISPLVKRLHNLKLKIF